VIVKNKILNAILWAILQAVKQLLFFIVCILIGSIMLYYLGYLTTGIIAIVGLVTVISIEEYKKNK